MAAERPRLLFLNGKNVLYDEAHVHVLSTAFKYAATIFEGIRAYYDERGDQLYVFRLREHVERLADSAAVTRISLPYSADELTEFLLRLIRENGLRRDLHIRLSVYVGEDDGRLDSTGDVGVMMAAMPMGRYDPLSADEGLHVGVSAWRRIADETMPPRVKSVANYQNSRLALLDAKAAGFQDAILLDQQGKVSEGPGYNLFLVRRGRVMTPAATHGILEGVTRDTLIQLFARVHDLEVVERAIDRTELYLASEAFFCGSGKEVTPIASIDRRPVGDGGIGERTRQIRETYFEVAKGRRQEFKDWLLPVW
jgi:branched-chain amino acid aminotransferase